MVKKEGLVICRTTPKWHVTTITLSAQNDLHKLTSNLSSPSSLVPVCIAGGVRIYAKQEINN